MKRLLLFITICISSVSFGQVPNYVPTNGLVGWWGFNGNANDESGNGNNGTVNGATLTTDRFSNANSAYDFVVNNVIDFGLSNDFSVTSAETKTITLWFQSATGKYPFLNKYENSVGSNSNFFIGGDAPAFSMSDGIIVTANGSNSLFWPVLPGNWFHVVAIYDGPNGIVDLFINGQYVTTAPLNYNNVSSSNPLIIQGTKMNIDYEDSDGKIDDIGIWNRALTQCEISELYHAQQFTPPVLAVSDTTSACGASTSLDAGTDPAWASYLWNTTETTQTISVSDPGLYTVEVTDTNGCIGYDTTLVSIIDPTIDQIDTNICNGDSLVLNVIPGNSCSPLPSNLQNGLVGYWPFCGNANDESGNGNDGTVNGAALTSDRFGNNNCAYEFDGINDYIIVNHQDELTLSNSDYSISCWILVSAPGVEYQQSILSKRLATNSEMGYILLAQDGGPQIGYSVCCGSDPQINSDTLIYLKWHNFSVTFDNSGNITKAYMDGNLVNTSSLLNSPIFNTENLSFGVENDFLSAVEYFFNGKIDDIGIWQRELSPSEIQQLYELGSYDITWSTGDTTSSITVQPTTTTTYSVTVSDGISSCVDDVTITVNDPQVDAGVDVDVCNGDDIVLSGAGADTYAWSGGVTDGVAFGPTVSEYYYVTGTDTLGCEDNDSVYVTVLQPTTSSITEANCDNYTAPDGQTYTSTGNYTAVIPNAVGCDSTITIDLTITNSTSSSITETVCDTYTAPDGATYTSTGNYTAVIPNAIGCDSTITIDLMVNNSNTETETVTECETYTWITNGQTYTQSGQYTEVLTNQNGCDSTVTLDLTINSSTSSTQTDTGLDSYTWSVNNQTYTQSGTYTAVIPNASGCDSTITLDLTLQFTGLNENESSYVAVYPNPTFNSFTLSTKDMIHMNYTLVDLQGKIVLTGKIESTEETVDISKLSKGQYNLVFEDESISPISIIKN